MDGKAEGLRDIVVTVAEEENVTGRGAAARSSLGAVPVDEAWMLAVIGSVRKR
jgi:hypothetical protein